MSVRWKGGRASQQDLFGGPAGGAGFWKWTTSWSGRRFSLVVVGGRDIVERWGGRYRWGLRDQDGEVLERGTCGTLKACREAAERLLEGTDQLTTGV